MKIGLIPLSGIRVCDTELLELGLTLPGFVERSRTIASLPSLGLLTLAGMTPAEHDIHYLEMPAIPAAGLPGDFDLVAISSYSAQIDEAYELAQRYRDAGTPVVIGGSHVTACPGEALRFASAVAQGEGESCWLDVLRDAARGRLQPVYKGKTTFDMTDAPMPAFERLDLEQYNRLTVQTSRGCPHRCEFCASSALLTRGYKQKPIARVLAEIDRICELWDHPFIEFADDNSFVDQAYWKELLPQLRARGLRWFTETDLSVAEDSELLDLMRDSGCAQVLIGLESPTPAGLDGLERRSNWKSRKLSDYADSIREIQSHGVTVNGCFILGLDGQTVDIFDEVMSFVRTCELYEVQITLMTPFPGTPLYKRLLDSGRLLEPTNWKLCTLFDINFEPADMSRAELQAGFRRLAVELYSEEFTHWRRRRFRENLRAERKKKGTHT